jgi:hypothetical protein
MTVNIPYTEFNERLAFLLRNSVSSDQFLVASKGAFWRLVGVGAFTFGLGLAAGFGFYGYSYVKRTSDRLDILSSTFASALAEVKLEAAADGTAQLEPKEITLAKGQTVSLDKNARLMLDPEAKIRADGEIQVQAPSISLPQTAGNQASQRVPTIANFTVFKRVPFGNGAVMTGWKF